MHMRWHRNHAKAVQLLNPYFQAVFKMDMVNVTGDIDFASAVAGLFVQLLRAQLHWMFF